MRRALLSALAVAAPALTVPGAAVAGGHHHHKGRSKAHHARVRFEHIGAAITISTTPPPGGPGTTEPTKTSTEPPASSGEDAGKVASFTGGVLTITLNDGSTVSGKVTGDTEIECAKAPSATPTTSGEDQGSGDDNEGDKSSSAEGDKSSGDSSEGDKEDAGDDDGQTPAASEPPCDSSALTHGTVVHEAELRISSAGAEFESIELVR
jgi:hypothetical protein